MNERAAPRWIHAAVSAAWRELRGYAGTTWAMIRRPGEFSVGWWRGQIEAPNPLAMLATGAALTAASRQAAAAVFGIERADTLLVAVLSALGPYVHYVLIGLLCHGPLRLLGKRKARLGDTIAMALYAGAGPAAIAEAAMWLLLIVAGHWLDADVLLPVALGVAFSAFTMALAANIGAMHDARVWMVCVAYAVAFPGSGLLFGLIQPSGQFGLHWVIGVRGGPPIGLGM